MTQNKALKDLEKRVSKLENVNRTHISTLHIKRFFTSLFFLAATITLSIILFKTADIHNNSFYYGLGVVVTFIFDLIFFTLFIISWWWFDE